MDRAVLLRRALGINRFLVAYNVAEAAAGLAFGLSAGSIALVGFGLDSVIETAAAATLIWRLRRELEGGPETCGPERRALLLVGSTLVLLAAYVTFESVLSLLRRRPPVESLPGIVLACLSLVLMPALAWRKLLIARELGSRALRADAIETAVCAYLSATLLAGLALSAALGWWWADPAAALAMVPLILWEGIEGIRESRHHTPDCTTVSIPPP
jgi:divalent metal cation (Fe/Co/Zn/Cd) transporter